MVAKTAVKGIEKFVKQQAMTNVRPNVAAIIAKQGERNLVPNFYNYVAKKFSKPVSFREEAFTPEIFQSLGFNISTKGSASTQSLKRIEEITPFLKRTQKGRIILKNLTDYRTARDPRNYQTLVTRAGHLEDINKELKGKLILKDNLKQWEDEKNLREFQEALKRTGLSGMDDPHRGFLYDYNKKYGTNLLYKMDISKKHGRKDWQAVKF